MKRKDLYQNLPIVGETDSIEHCYLHPAYGDMQLIRKTATNVYMVYWNGVKWKALEEEKEN